MVSIRTTACALALLLLLPETSRLGAAPAGTAAVDPLVGLWKAKKRFGPDDGGLLHIEKEGGRYFADMGGRTFPVRLEGRELSFSLADRRGSFRGRLDKNGSIRGHWIRGSTPVNPGFASPVDLKRNGRGRWAGTVSPLQDAFTFYLLVKQEPDGSLGAVLRNPERDIGTQLGVRRLLRDGKAIKLMGGRPGTPEREIAAGAFDAENRLLTLYLPNRGGTYDFAPDDERSDFYPRGRNPEPYSYRAPPPREDGWPTGTLEEAGIDRLAMIRLVQNILETPMDSQEAPQIHALLIARNGKLVLEEYFHGYSRDRLHDTRSAGKSVTSVVVGAALHAGAPLKLSSPVYQVLNGGSFPPGLEAGKASMTLEHLLTMSSGYFCDDTNEAAPGNEDGMQEQSEEPDWVRYTLRVPLITPPGENSVYCSASPNLALAMVGAATGETPLHAFDKLVAGPMQFGRYAWFVDPTGRPYGGGGVQILPRDFLKLGQMMLDGGTWHGRRILDRDYAARAGSPLYHLRNLTYGYLWWVQDYPYKDRTVHSYSARGAGGQTVTVIPELDLVVETMAGNYSGRVQITWTGTIVPRLILPAVRERGDDPKAPVRERDYVNPYGRSTDGSRVAGSN